MSMARFAWGPEGNSAPGAHPPGETRTTKGQCDSNNSDKPGPQPACSRFLFGERESIANNSSTEDFVETARRLTDGEFAIRDGVFQPTHVARERHLTVRSTLRLIDELPLLWLSSMRLFKVVSTERMPQKGWGLSLFETGIITSHAKSRQSKRRQICCAHRAAPKTFCCILC